MMNNKRPKAMSIEQLCSLPNVFIGSSVEKLPDSITRLFFSNNGKEWFCDLPLAYQNFYGNSPVRVVPSTNPEKAGKYYFRYLSNESTWGYEAKHWHVHLDHLSDENGGKTWIAGVYENRDPMFDYPLPSLPFFEYEASHQAKAQQMAEDWGKTNLGDEDIWLVSVKGGMEQYKGTDTILAQIEYISAAITARTSMPYMPAPRLFKNGVEAKRKPVTTVTTLIRLEKQRKQALARVEQV